MTMARITTEEEYQAAIETLERVFDAEEGTPEFEQAQVLADRITEYEDRHFPID
jgi:HTH-type transcriptional regulator/antitoxin HigA